MQRVLAVDDNPRNLLIIEKSLAGQFELVTAASGEAALEIAPRFRPDLILLDIMMTGIDGYETCRRLRAMPGVSACKIIMVSARGATSDRLAGYAAGANDFVIKPFDPDELVAKLRVYLQLKSVEEVDRLKSELLSLLSHETRTPLTGILGPTALLLDDPNLSVEQREFLAMIRRSAMRLLSLIEKVMYLSELKAGVTPREFTRIDLRCALAEALTKARARTSREDVTIDLDVDSSASLEADAAQLGIALEALLDNALRLSPSGGAVKVQVHEDEPSTSITVSDQGPGIAPDFIERVFDEFAVQSIQHHGRGHGLGLATARLIVEQHGGSLSVESELGHGAAFRMQMPARHAAAIAA